MDWFADTVNRLFGPMMRVIFRPTNAIFEGLSAETSAFLAKGSAMLLFFGAMAWVFLLKKEYVNLDAPSKKPWHDLRFWTVVSLLPHVIVYLWF